MLLGIGGVQRKKGHRKKEDRKEGIMLRSALILSFQLLLFPFIRFSLHLFSGSRNGYPNCIAYRE